MKVRWTPEANSDLADIIAYIGDDNPAAARKMRNLFIAAVQKLENTPLIGRTGLIAGTRELIPHQSYRVVYKIAGDTIWIVAVFHTRRRWPPVIEGG